ncbi:MAG TPA: radical SAM protein [Bryobacteraceae bacterium]|jgi:DNA repair photolyase|nr:radical SAM protein [Bryobacteraceae bacterium]
MSASAPALVGIAKLATEGHVLTSKSRVEYRTLPTRRLLNRCDSHRVPFDWTINPYRGCEYGCKYCYARYTHEFMERWHPEAFETEIYTKDWDEAAFRRELRSVRRGQSIALGTATDPYQPAERRYERSRRILEVLATVSDRRVYLTTKSDLCARDIDLWQKVAERNHVAIAITVTTTDAALARLMEPYAPRPDLRLAAVAKFAEAGIRVGVIASPVLPMITDSASSLDAIGAAAKRAGAVTFSANVLFLKPCSQRVFFPFLEQQFPHLFARYKANYEHEAFINGPYPDRIRQLVKQIRERYGLFARDAGEAPAPSESEQLTLFS